MIDTGVEAFIHRRFKNDCNWTSGNCYYFAIILKTRFPHAHILYDVIAGHFFVRIGHNYYDWTGRIEEPEEKVYWDDMDIYDKRMKRRIVKDCIL